MYRIIKGAQHSNKRPRKPLPKILSTVVMDQGVWPEGKAHFRKEPCFSRQWHSCYSGYDYSSKEVTRVHLNFNLLLGSGQLFMVGLFFMIASMKEHGYPMLKVVAIVGWYPTICSTSLRLFNTSVILGIASSFSGWTLVSLIHSW